MNWISVPLLSYVVVLCLSTLNAVKESNKWGFLSHHILLKLFLKLKDRSKRDIIKSKKDIIKNNFMIKVKTFLHETLLITLNSIYYIFLFVYE